MRWSTFAYSQCKPQDLQDECRWRSADVLADILSELLCALQLLDNGLAGLHIPYSYGFAIILLTILVKIVTFPLTKKQVRCCLEYMGVWSCTRNLNAGMTMQPSVTDGAHMLKYATVCA